MGTTMRNAAAAALLVLAGGATGACGGASSRATTTVTDSAGVQVVTNPPGSIEAAQAWRLAADAAVEIGAGASPDAPLYRIAAVVPLPGGRVAIGTQVPPHVLVFASDGTLAATLGRQGDGPGEFHGVASVVPIGADSLAVWDDRRRRMSVFTTDGSFQREVGLSALAPLTPIAATRMEGLLAWTHLLPSAQGSLVLFAVGVLGDPGPGVIRVAAPSHRITAGGDVLAAFGPFPGEELYSLGGSDVFPYIFGATTHAAASNGALVVGTADAPELRAYGPDGTLQRIIRWPDHDRTVGGPLLAQWSEAEADWITSMSAELRPLIRELLERMPRPERFPAYDGIIAGEDGRVWVGEYAGQLEIVYPPLKLRASERRWLIFDADGALTASVRTPEGFEPHAVRDGLVWGVYRDTLDIESVRAYELVRL
ncbi:MAG TPA: hypothetical protein VF192_14360 [Longimicrobiales bacterium]